MERYNRYKEAFNKLSNDILDSIIKNDNLKKRVKYCLDGGKRLRPIISMDICTSLGFKEESVIKSSLAIELIHNASLIIDDLPCMDDDDFRRGKLSFHKKYGQLHSQLVSQYMMSLALKLINDNYIENHDNHFYIINNLCKNLGIMGVAGGQLMDVTPISQYSNKKDIINGFNNKSVIEDLFKKKTCSLFEISFIIGYLSNEKYNESVINYLIEASNHFGIAFQIYDDFDDIEQDKKRKEIDLFDPNYINNFGKDSAFEKFIYSLDKFRDIMKKINLYSDLMKQLYNFLYNKVKMKINNI